MEYVLHLFGELCPQSYKKFSLIEMINSFFLFLHFKHVDKSSASWIGGTEWRKQFSDLHHVKMNSCSKLLLLICVFLAFLTIFCEKSFCKPVSWLNVERPKCDGRLIASSLFRRLVSRGASLRGFPTWWAMQFAISLARCLMFFTTPYLVTWKALDLSVVARTTPYRSF